MARVNIDLKRNIPVTTDAFVGVGDYVNYTGDTIQYCIFEAGDTENEFPRADASRAFIGLPWPDSCVIPVKAGERLHIVSRHHEGRVEGHEAAA